jgi:rhodanese-related sulfurtransferase/DNA-binding transcriptional ArsR family regulator
MKVPASGFRPLLFEQFARVARALANPHRLQLVELLAQGERRVDELARQTGLSMANTSQHLQSLRHGGLVESRRDGTAIYYRLADERVFRLWQAIREVGEARLAEVDVLVRDYLADRGELQAIDAATLQRRLREDDLLVLDVRPTAEFEAGHIPGARSIPLPELTARLDEIPPDHTIVAYCRGPYCVFADEAVALLRERGYRALRLAEGLPDWRAAGLPVVSTASNRIRRSS